MNPIESHAGHWYDGLANTRAMAEADSELARRVLELRIDGRDDKLVADCQFYGSRGAYQRDRR